MRSTWNPEQYARFGAERSQPFHDLLALVHRYPSMRVVDLGCGTGELTAQLHDQMDACETVGLDNSETMLAKSHAYERSDLRFEPGDIALFNADGREDGRYHLIFSNAALQWVPDHEPLLGRLTDALTLDGQVAVQVPANYDYPTHTVAAEVASEAPFRDALGGYVLRRPVLPPEQYATLLNRLGYREQHVRLQVYTHYLASREDVVEWVKGTLLTDYQRRMPAELFARFLQEYRVRLLPHLDDTRPFFYPFKRILFWAAR